MSLAEDVRTAPIPFDPEKARDLRARFIGLGASFAELVAGAGACSPHLDRLLSQEEGWLRSVVDKAPAVAMADVIDAIDPAGPDLATGLRVAKRRGGLLVALADLGGLWTLEEVTGALTDLADRCVAAAIGFLVSEEQRRGKLPEVEATDGGLFALAMGKMGARELNYSSDIDLILLFDETLYPAGDYAEIRRVFIRAGQRLVKLLSDITAEGYVFRTDLRLRPDPSVTPVCIGMGAAERYYEAHGRTWERAAMIKARVCAGDMAAGARFLDDIAPFIWRRHLDFATIEEAHDMRRRIREHKGLGGPLELPGHNVKLGRGGIREIEFFAQTRQLICGGRDPGLRQRTTKAALAALAKKGWIEADIRDRLTDAYAEHRVLEHRIQMLEDAQTHIYPTAEPARRRLASFCGATDVAAFEVAQIDRFRAVEAMAEAFFAPGSASEPATDPWIAFPDPEAARSVARTWQDIPALRTDRARAIFDRLSPQLSTRLCAAADPHRALTEFDRFLRGLPAGVQVLSLFEANPRILDLLVDICAIAPRLAEYLGRNSAVLDALLGRDFFDPLSALDDLRAQLGERLAACDGYEAVLDATRIWTRELNFRVGVQLLQQIATPREAARAFSRVAEAVVGCLLPHVTAEHARRFGPPPGRGAAVIAMGKLGSEEMTAASDLDLIVIYDAPHDAMSEGPKALAVPAYFARLTQALISALTAPTAEGTLYSVDMRLRPSGRQGPVAASLRAFAGYQREEAWTWEHLALTRARVIAGGPDLTADLERAIAAALDSPRDPKTVLADAAEMRRRLAEAHDKAESAPWEVKLGPGRLQDIELALQTGRVLHPTVAARAPAKMIPELVTAGYLSKDDGELLRRSLRQLTAIQQISRIALGEGFDPDRAGPGLVRLVVEAAGAADLETLERDLASGAEKTAGIVTRLLGG